MKDAYCELQSPNSWLEIKQCQEIRGFCSGRKNLQCLSSTVWSSDFSNHLFLLCSFNNLICLIFSPLSCMSLLHKLYMKPLPNMWFANFFSFQRLPFNFINGFFYYAEGFEFDVVSLVYFCSSSLCLCWLTCLSCFYFGKWPFISCFIRFYLLPFLPKDTDWMNGYKNKAHIYAVYKRPTSVLETHTDWKSEEGKW